METQEEPKKDTKNASIHEFMSENKRYLHKQQIAQLFSSSDLSQMDLNEFSRHQYMQSCEMFTYFVHQLQKWNRKIRNKEIKPFYHAQLNRNLFIFSSLKIICLKKPNQINRYLQDLTLWYNKNSYNVPQPSVLMKKYNPNEEWEIRKTFKSNSPSEINLYRRRFLCIPDEKNAPFTENFFQLQRKKQNCFFEFKPQQNKTSSYSKTSANDFQQERNFLEPFKQVMKNKDIIKLAKLQHNQIREKKQQKQIQEIQDSWKSSHSRFTEKTFNKFFNGKFIKNKQFLQMAPVTESRKVQTADFNRRIFDQADLLNSVKKGRIMTSLGIRKNFKYQQNEGQKGKRISTTKTESNEEAKDELTVNWIDKFQTDEEKIDLRKTLNNEGPSMVLISNPFDTAKNKIRKKRR